MWKNYSTIKKIFTWIIVALITITVWLVSVLITEHNIEWARSLNKWRYNPPGWIFYIVWTVLFILIAISVIIILNKKTSKKKKEISNVIIAVFLINAVLNMLYSFLYFGIKNILLAFIDLPFLIASIIILIWLTNKISKIAAYLLIPYLIWVCFATFLTGITLFIN
jgi:tryptophan-rich sensory protein